MTSVSNFQHSTPRRGLKRHETVIVMLRITRQKKRQKVIVVTRLALGTTIKILIILDTKGVHFLYK